MSIHERAIDGSALLDFRRQKDKTQIPSGKYRKVITLEEYLGEIQSPERLRDARYEIIGVAGGDGTVNLAVNLGVDTLVLEGGGTANTLLTALRRVEEFPIPDHLSGMFPPEFYSARIYRPPVVMVDDDEKSSFQVAYVLGACHLTVETNRLYDVVRERFNQRGVRASYILAGFGSAVQLYNRGFEPLRPTALRYELDGQEYQGRGDYLYLGLAAIGVPRLGPYGFRNEIDPEKLRLLTLSGEDNRQIRARFVLMLLLGAFSPNWVIDWGLVNAVDVNSVSFLPDLTNSQRPNANVDGELRFINGRVSMERSSKELTIIIPRHLL